MKPNDLTEPLTDDILLPDTDEEQQDEMYEHFSLTVDKGQALLRIDKFLTNRMEGASRNRIQTAADAGNILVNGKPVKSSYKVKPLDRISIVMPYPVREVEIIPENIPLDIPYEDEDIIIVNKPAGMVVHPGHGNYSGTLVNALTYHLKDLPLFQSGDMRAGLVHRIDKNTSGILVIAKNDTMSTWNFRNFELRRAIFGEFCRLFGGKALFCFVFRVHIADVAGNVFVVIGIGVAVFCSEIFSSISEELVAGEKRPPCVFHRIRAIRGKKRLPLLCGEILIDEFIVFADAEREAVCAADLPREHAKKFIAHHCEQVNGE